MHEEQNNANDEMEGLADEGERALAELPDQLARARAVVRRAREQLSVHLASDGADSSGG